MKFMLLLCTIMVISAFHPEFWGELSIESFLLLLVISGVALATDICYFFSVRPE